MFEARRVDPGLRQELFRSRRKDNRLWRCAIDFPCKPRCKASSAVSDNRLKDNTVALKQLDKAHKVKQSYMGGTVLDLMETR